MPKLPVAAPTKLKDVYLVQPPIGGTKADVQPPLGLLLLGAIVEAGGRRAHVVDLNLRSKAEGFDPERSLRAQMGKVLPKDGVDLVGVTTWSYGFDVAMEFIQEVRKKHKRVPIVLGGPHVTFVDREVLEAFPKDVDYIIRDEGDATFPQLLEALEAGANPDALAAIPGLTWRRDGEIVRNPSGSVTEDLDALPLPAYHLIDVQDYLANNPVLVIEAGRGCPYNCNFCSTTNMFQRNYRVKSAARLVDEIEWLAGVTGTNRFELLHDNLVANKRYVKELCAEIRGRNLDVDWSCTSRTDNITEEVAEEMFLAGCGQVFFGIESLDASRQQWTGKKLEPRKVEEAIRLTARQHITPMAGIIVGFPEETADEFDATVGAALRWTTDPKVKAEISTGLLRYYPGADLFAHADALRYDPLLASTSTALPGYTFRKAWRKHPRLFPTQMIHTSPQESRENLLKALIVRAILDLVPLTVRAAQEVDGFGPRALVERMLQHDYTCLNTRDNDLTLNEVAHALGEALRQASPIVKELLEWEAPFWETRVVAPPLEAMEHIIHPKRYHHDELLAFARGERADPPSEIPGRSLVAARAGREVAVFVTPDPANVLERLRAQVRQRGLG